MSEKIQIDLNIYDENDPGNVIDTTTAELSREQLSDIVDHAAQFIEILRAKGNGDLPEGLALVAAELEEALVSSDVLPELDNVEPPSPM